MGKTYWDLNIDVPLSNNQFWDNGLVKENNIQWVLNDSDNDTLGIKFHIEQKFQSTPIKESQILIYGDSTSSGFHSFSAIYQTYDLIVINLDFENPHQQKEAYLIEGIIQQGVLQFDFIGLTETISRVNITFLQLTDHASNTLELSYPTEHVISKFEFAIEIITTNLLPPKSGELRISFPDDIQCNYFRGYIDQLQIDIEDFTSEIDIDYPYNIENAMKLKCPSLFFNIKNLIGFDCYLFAEIIAENTRTGQISIAYIVNQKVEAALVHYQARSTTINIPDDLLHDILEWTPDIINFQNSYYLITTPFLPSNPSNYLPGFIYSRESLQGYYELNAPFSFQFSSGFPLQPRKISGLSISNKNRELIKKCVQEANITLYLTNYFSMAEITTSNNIKLRY